MVAKYRTRITATLHQRQNISGFRVASVGESEPKENRCVAGVNGVPHNLCRRVG